MGTANQRTRHKLNGEVKVTIVLTRRQIVAALVAAVLMVGGVALGLKAYLHAKASVHTDQYLRTPGDAPEPVQVEVRAALRDFQNGYIQRDPKNLDAFMGRLFEKDSDILIIGVNPSEWIRGYAAASDFIRADWVYWGDFRFAIDDAMICSSGDVAWVASVGTVRTKGGDRPVRFTAILTRKGDRWFFRQAHFQWENGATGALRHLLDR